MNKVSAWGALIISLTVFLIFLALMVFIFVMKLTDQMSLVTGSVLTMASGVVSYWVGSSQSSAHKDQVIAATKGVSTNA